jgi:hypothetical protein
VPFDAAAARALDALIAATAIANGLPLYTCNPDNFAGIVVPAFLGSSVDIEGLAVHSRLIPSFRRRD